MQKQVQQYQAIQSVIHEEKELETDPDAKRTQHKFHMLLKEMLFEYETWKGYTPDRRFDLELSVSDKRIHAILSMRQLWHPSNGIQTIHLLNIRMEEGTVQIYIQYS